MRIGIDWGGTKIEAIALSNAGAVLACKRIATPQHDYDACVFTVACLVREIEALLGQTGTVGIGIPGAILPATGLVKNANSVWLNGRALDKDMARALGRAVRIENDANCLAVSEAVDGAGAGAAVVWAVILGTGAGSGIAVQGRALVGRHRIAGEWGHNPLPWLHGDERPSPPCYCGRRGCLETFVSGTGLSAEHRRRTGLALTAKAVMDRMRAGDPEARLTYDVFLDRLARGLAQVINIVDPDVIVLGGGLSDVDELYADLPTRIAPFVFSDAFDTLVLKPQHGSSLGVRGPAWLWNRWARSRNRKCSSWPHTSGT